MKKIFVVLMAVIALAACSTLTQAEKEQRKMAQKQAVEKALADRHYTIDVLMMYPQKGPGRQVNGDYSLEVKGDTLVSYLPYFGRAYQVPYGGGKGLNFSAVMDYYSATTDAKGKTIVVIGVTNDEDTYEYTLSIFDNGSTTIDVSAQQREHISYSGRMDCN